MNDRLLKQSGELEDELIKLIVDEIPKLVPINRLYLLGVTKALSHTITFCNTRVSSIPSIQCIYFLVVIQPGDKQSINTVKDKLENNLQHIVPVTMIVISETNFKDWFSAGHPLAIQVSQVVPLARFDKADVTIKPHGITSNTIQPISEEFEQSKIKIREFIAGAELFMVRRQYNMCIFMLHQAAEQMLRGAMLLKSGLKINTHNIDSLIRTCLFFYPDLSSVFSKKNEKEHRILSILNKAYIDSRYGKEYFISSKDLKIIYDKVCSMNTLIVSSTSSL